MEWDSHQIEVRTEFRKFLRHNKLAAGLNLSNIMKATDSHLSLFIRKYLDSDFTSVYDNNFTIEQLAQYYEIMKKNGEWAAMEQGYISLRSLELYLTYLCEKNGVKLNEIKENAVNNTWSDSDTTVTEGCGVNQTSIRYERSKRARERCLAKWGYKCYICGMDFESVYGEIGKGFIEVHHKTPISSHGGEYQFVPERDLVPLCSNCHSMVHYKTVTPRDVDVLKKLFRKKWTNI